MSDKFKAETKAFEPFSHWRKKTHQHLAFLKEYNWQSFPWSNDSAVVVDINWLQLWLAVMET